MVFAWVTFCLLLPSSLKEKCQNVNRKVCPSTQDLSVSNPSIGVLYNTQSEIKDVDIANLIHGFLQSVNEDTKIKVLADKRKGHFTTPSHKKSIKICAVNQKHITHTLDKLLKATPLVGEVSHQQLFESTRRQLRVMGDRKEKKK